VEGVRKMTKFKDFEDDHYFLKTRGGGVYKTKKRPEDRSYGNCPKYANGRNRVDFKEWLEIKGEKRHSHSEVTSFGKAANGKWYGWSHRAIHGFKAGDDVTGDSLGKKVTYPKAEDGTMDFDNGEYEPDFTIKDNKHAREVAKTFADNVG
jgi:hypothetical protein